MKSNRPGDSPQKIILAVAALFVVLNVVLFLGMKLGLMSDGQQAPVEAAPAE